MFERFQHMLQNLFKTLIDTLKVFRKTSWSFYWIVWVPDTEVRLLRWSQHVHWSSFASSFARSWDVLIGTLLPYYFISIFIILTANIIRKSKFTKSYKFPKVFFSEILWIDEFLNNDLENQRRNLIFQFNWKSFKQL